MRYVGFVPRLLRAATVRGHRLLAAVALYFSD
jgi:hypothetical protein